MPPPSATLCLLLFQRLANRVPPSADLPNQLYLEALPLVASAVRRAGGVPVLHIISEGPAVKLPPSLRASWEIRVREAGGRLHWRLDQDDELSFAHMVDADIFVQALRSGFSAAAASASLGLRLGAEQGIRSDRDGRVRSLGVAPRCSCRIFPDPPAPGYPRPKGSASDFEAWLLAVQPPFPQHPPIQPCKRTRPCSDFLRDVRREPPRLAPEGCWLTCDDGQQAHENHYLQRSHLSYLNASALPSARPSLERDVRELLRIKARNPRHAGWTSLFTSLVAQADAIAQAGRRCPREQRPRRR